MDGAAVCAKLRGAYMVRECVEFLPDGRALQHDPHSPSRQRNHWNLVPDGFTPVFTYTCEKTIYEITRFQ